MSFAFSDPTGLSLLEQEQALSIYRNDVGWAEQRAASVPGTAFVPQEHFGRARTADGPPDLAKVPWLAYPRLAHASHAEIDADRFRWQDEYAEWITLRDARGNLRSVTFTTEFPTYWSALAFAGEAALVHGIQAIYLDAQPTTAELFGHDFDPTMVTGEERARRFVQHLSSNPWNDGRKGVLCLTHPNNTLDALYGLVAPCAVPNPNFDPADTCAHNEGACVVGRNSDPSVCQACQNFARAGRVLSLSDPVGVRLLTLGGFWKVQGVDVDINDPAMNQDVWQLSRNGRRAVLDLSSGVLLNDEPVLSGAQVAAVLMVGAEVVSAPRSNVAPHVLPKEAL